MCSSREIPVRPIHGSFDDPFSRDVVGVASAALIYGSCGSGRHFCRRQPSPVVHASDVWKNMLDVAIER